jgi:hypothetical protein
MHNTTCCFDDASLLMDESAMVEMSESSSIVFVEDEEGKEERVEDVGKIQQTIDSTMCNTACGFDDTPHPTNEPAMIEMTESASSAVAAAEEDEEKSLEDNRKMIQDLFHSDNATVDTTLDALFHLTKDKKKNDKIQAVGGLFALILLVNNCLDKVIDSIPACDQVTTLDELAELTTLRKTLGIIISLTCHHFESRAGIATIGGVEAVVKVMKTFPRCQTLQKRACRALANLIGSNVTGKKQAIESDGCLVLVQLVNNCLDMAIDRISACDQVTDFNEYAELMTLDDALYAITSLTSNHDESKIGIAALGGAEAVVKVMKTFPKCQTLQERACGVLINLVWCSIGSANAIESNGIEILLAAINNHLDSAVVCQNACWALYNIILDDKAGTELLITMGGGAAVAKVRTNWPNNDDVQTQVRRVTAQMTATTAANTDHIIGALIKDLLSSDNATVNAALVALFMGLEKDPTTCANIVALDGCHALVQLLKNCLEKAIDSIPAYDRVTELYEFDALAILDNTLRLITNLTFNHYGSQAGMTAIGGVKAVVKAMSTFPKCQALQECACAALRNLTSWSIGKAKAIESGGIEVLLAAINNHLASAKLCESACSALFNITIGSKENTMLLITLGGGAAAVKVGTKWPDNDDVQQLTCNFDDSSLLAISLLAIEPAMTETSESANMVVVVEHEEDEEGSLEGLRKMIQDLVHSDSAKVNATLDAFYLALYRDEKESDKIQAVGGCFVLINLLKKCLDTAIDSIPACEQVTNLNEHAELTTLQRTLSVIIGLTFQHDKSRFGICTVGGVEALVKVIKTFPKCLALQDGVCDVLSNLANCSIGKEKAIESGVIEVLLAAINNHLGSAKLCESACSALFNIASGSKENTGLLITLGGGAAAVKVGTKWPDKNHVQTQVRNLANLIV